MTFKISPLTAVFLGGGSLLLAACDRPQIRAYTAPRDSVAMATPAPTASVAPAERPSQKPEVERPKPKVSFGATPAGWQTAKPSDVSLVGFQIEADGGKAGVTITPLPNLEGQETLVVNMYRQQAGLAPVEQSQLDTILKPVDVAGGSGKLLEIEGTTEGKPVRVITAISHRDGRSWFYRLSGDDAIVVAQKPAFLEFIKTVKIEEPAPETGPGVASAPAAPEKPKFNWAIPTGWSESPIGQMQVAKFAVPEQGGAKADVTVSIFPGDTGGTLANVNRWLKQLGAPETDIAGLANLVTPLDPALPNAQLIMLSHENRSILGAIVPRGDQFFFYKLMGDSAAVVAARDSFVAFAKSQP